MLVRQVQAFGRCRYKIMMPTEEFKLFCSKSRQRGGG